MRKTVLAAVAAVAIAGAAGGGALLAQAQPAPGGAPGGPVVGAPGPDAGGPGWMHRWMHHHREGMEGERGRPFEAGTFALFHRPADRQLTAADVQKIAEGFLLWNGNHTWKVTDVGPAADGQIGFAFAAPDNTVIARFSMDAKTGRLTRTG